MSETETVVFVVDDDQDIRVSLSRALRMRGYTVEAYDSAQAFLEAYDESRIGCLVLDYGLPGMSGLELQAHINRAGFPLPIIFITGHGGVPESVQAMKGGAVDFLEKPFRQSVLAERIETACRMAVEMTAAAGRRRDIDSRFDRLTAREREIVDFMVGHPGEVTSKEIGRTLDISPRTVDHHRARILEKLELRSVVELIDLAKGLPRGA
ncbi:response regulator transcription factor [Albibacillus kandeliae]|uniref:response regulator transcription factor n=1 Tax=Albibacillus kandeliae TaxID=2174228 RepID=UPI000D687B7B|nr:response regulator [Albibacillus kandeliae]